MADKVITDADVIEQIRAVFPTVSTNKSGLTDYSTGFFYRGIINIQDFDSINSNGIYQISNATGNNAPTTFGVMVVFSASTMELQIVASAIYPFLIFLRVKGFGEPVWKNWVTITGQ